MNILMTSCGCSRLGAVAKSASKERARNQRGVTVRRGALERGTQKNRLQQKGSPRSLLSLEIIIAPLTVARLVRFSALLFSPVSSCPWPTSLSPFLFLSHRFCRTLVSFYGNCVYGTARELQVFVILRNCRALVTPCRLYPLPGPTKCPGLG